MSQELVRNRLLERARMLRTVRAFFDSRGVVEVDCPALSKTASVDAHIDLIPSGAGYLFSSPEYGMKKLLASGSGDIYQLSHVFRSEEVGPMHREEFMLLEWYRIGVAFETLIAEVCEVCELFLGDQKREELTYREAFLRYAGIDPFEASVEELLQRVEPYEGWELEGKDALLNLILGNEVEPKLGQGQLTVLRDYPASQAALAKKRGEVALRFEVYYEGIELANGFDELGDANEQQARLEEANALREQLGKGRLPIDTEFIAALESGLPECCGVAVGFDRLLMLMRGEREL